MSKRESLRYLIAALVGILLWTFLLQRAWSQQVYEFSISNCPPCAQMEPEVDACIRAGYRIQKVKDNQALARQFGVKAYPSLVVIQSNQAHVYEGYQSAQQIVASIRSFSGVDPSHPVVVSKPQQAQAQSPSPTPNQWRGSQQIHPAVVRVSCLVGSDGNSTSYDQGSGTYIDYENTAGYVLTNWHVVQEAQQITVTFPSGFSSYAVIETTNPTWDIALLRIAKAPNVEPVQLASSVHLQEQVWMAGYGEKGTYLRQEGVYAKELAPGQGYPYDVLGVQGPHPRQGDSGGPVLNSKGELAGVLYGGTPGEAVATSCLRIRLLMQGYRLRWCKVVPRRKGGSSPPAPTVTYPSPSSTPTSSTTPADTNRGATSPTTAPTFEPPLQSVPQTTPSTNSPTLAVSPADVAGLKQQLQDLQNQLATMKPVPGPPGPPGQDGKDGSPGSPGPPGADSTAPAVSQVVQAAEQKIHGAIHFRVSVVPQAPQ